MSSIAESIVQKAHEVNVFKFKPDLPISELASAGEQQHASKLVSRVQQHHAKQISALVKQRYAECSKVISSGVLQEFGDEIKLNWMREHYFKIVEEVLDASSTKPDGSDSVTNAVSAIEWRGHWWIHNVWRHVCVATPEEEKKGSQSR